MLLIKSMFYVLQSRDWLPRLNTKNNKCSLLCFVFECCRRKGEITGSDILLVLKL